MPPDPDENKAAENPTLTADFKAAEDTPPEPGLEPSVEMEKPPEKSASERLLDSVMELPEDERNAALSSIEKRLEEKGEAPPWKARQEEEVAARTAAASQDAERERRQADIRSWQTNSDAARANVDWLVNDLNERWEKRAAAVLSAGQTGQPVDDPAPRLDTVEFEKQLNAHASAQAALLSHTAISEIGNAMHDAIAEHGGTITQEELSSITKAVSRADKVRAYMNALAARVNKEVSAEMEKDIDKRIKAEVANELGARRMEGMRDMEVAPETRGAGPKPGQKRYSEMTAAERANLSKEDRQTLTAAALEG